jgi:hypothetical protein
MGLVTLVEPGIEPVSLGQMKTYLRVDPGFMTDDIMIGGLITAARRWAEEYCQRRFVYQTLRLLMDFFPGYIDLKLAGEKVSSPFVSGSNAVLVGIRYAIQLPCPKVRAVVNFQYQDQNGNPTQLINNETFFEDLASQPARLTPPFGQMWPVARVITNAVTVDYVTGYGGPATVSVAAASQAVTGVTFYQEDVGLPISIPGAGPLVNNVATALSTTISAVDGSGNGTLATASTTAVANASAWLGKQVPQLIDVAIMLLVNQWYQNRDENADIPQSVKSILSPHRDLRF